MTAHSKTTPSAHDDIVRRLPSLELEDDCSVSSEDEEAELCFGASFIEQYDSDFELMPDDDESESFRLEDYYRADEVCVLKTFNSMYEVTEENISAVALIEKEKQKDLEPENETRGSLAGFVEARVDTFSKNVDYITHNKSEHRGHGHHRVPSEPRTSLAGFVEARVDTFHKNVDYITEAASASKEEELDSMRGSKHDKQRSSFSGFVQGRVGTFARNIETISSVFIAKSA